MAEAKAIARGKDGCQIPIAFIQIPESPASP